jgi:hypothetical protein
MSVLLLKKYTSITNSPRKEGRLRQSEQYPHRQDTGVVMDLAGHG